MQLGAIHFSFSFSLASLILIFWIQSLVLPAIHLFSISLSEWEGKKWLASFDSATRILLQPLFSDTILSQSGNGQAAYTFHRVLLVPRVLHPTMRAASYIEQDAQRRLPYPCLLGTNSFLLGRFMSCFVPAYNDPLLQNTASTDAGCELHRTRCSATLARVPYSSLVDFWLSMPVQSSLTQLPTGVNKTTLSLQNFKLALHPFSCFSRAN